MGACWVPAGVHLQSKGGNQPGRCLLQSTFQNTSRASFPVAGTPLGFQFVFFYMHPRISVSIVFITVGWGFFSSVHRLCPSSFRLFVRHIGRFVIRPQFFVFCLPFAVTLSITYPHDTQDGDHCPGLCPYLRNCIRIRFRMRLHLRVHLACWSAIGTFIFFR